MSGSVCLGGILGLIMIVELTVGFHQSSNAAERLPRITPTYRREVQQYTRPIHSHASFGSWILPRLSIRESGCGPETAHTRYSSQGECTLTRSPELVFRRRSRLQTINERFKKVMTGTALVVPVCSGPLFGALVGAHMASTLHRKNSRKKLSCTRILRAKKRTMD